MCRLRECRPHSIRKAVVAERIHQRIGAGWQLLMPFPVKCCGELRGWIAVFRRPVAQVMQHWVRSAGCDVGIATQIPADIKAAAGIDLVHRAPFDQAGWELAR